MTKDDSDNKSEFYKLQHFMVSTLHNIDETDNNESLAKKKAQNIFVAFGLVTSLLPH